MSGDPQRKENDDTPLAKFMVATPPVVITEYRSVSLKPSGASRTLVTLPAMGDETLALLLLKLSAPR